MKITLRGGGGAPLFVRINVSSPAGFYFDAKWVFFFFYQSIKSFKFSTRDADFFVRIYIFFFSVLFDDSVVDA